MNKLNIKIKLFVFSSLVLIAKISFASQGASQDPDVFFSPNSPPFVQVACTNVDQIFPFNSCIHMPTLADLAIQKAKAEKKTVLFLFGHPKSERTQAMIRLLSERNQSLNGALIDRLKKDFIVTLIRTRTGQEDLDWGAGMMVVEQYAILHHLKALPAIMTLRPDAETYRTKYIDTDVLEINENTQDKLELKLVEADFFHSPDQLLKAISN